MSKFLIKSSAKFSTSTYHSLVSQVSKELSDLEIFVKRRTAEGYWKIGKHIHAHLLKNEKRAGYGDALLGKLAKDVNRDETTLSRSVQFYRAYPIPAAPQELTWEHYKSLIAIKDKDERKKIEAKVIDKEWNTKQLREYLSSKREENAPIKTDQPIPKLKFTRGIVGAFQIVVRANPRGYSEAGERRGSPLRLDLGFRLHHVLPTNAPRVKDGEIVEIIFKDDRPAGIAKSKATANDLFTYRARVDKIIDGDTMLVTFDFIDFSISQKLRLRGIDCPEADTDEGKKAGRFVASCLKDLRTITVKTHKDRSDKFDRYLADIFYGPDEVYLNQQLLDEGLAAIYEG